MRIHRCGYSYARCLVAPALNADTVGLSSLTPDVSEVLHILRKLRKHISTFLFSPRTECAGVAAASFPHSVAPLDLGIVPLWLIATFDRSTKNSCPLNGHIQLSFCPFQPKLYSNDGIKQKCKMLRTVHRVVSGHSPQFSLFHYTRDYNWTLCSFPVHLKSSVYA